MSRSYRKPWVVDGYGGCKKEAKRRANRDVRLAKEVANGGYYKKLHCSWNICDYRWLVPKPLEDKIRYRWSGTIVWETLEEQLRAYRKISRK